MGKIENHPDKLNGKKRSNKWPKVRKAWLKKYPRCAVCGGKTKITVHHLRPFHLYPELELVRKNFITLCEGNKNINCHLALGHFNNFMKKYNPNIKELANQLRPMFMSKKKMS